LYITKKWVIAKNDEDKVNNLMKQYKIGRIAALVLQNRPQLIVNGKLNDSTAFYDPFLMKGMKEGVEHIASALKNGEQITIYGDFDADGVTSTSVLYMYLKDRGANVDYYIPDRVDEGYGINKKALETIKQRGTNLLITVDTGITAVQELSNVEDDKFKVIVTDHHEPKEDIPKCTAVIDPKQFGCGYPFKELAGVGVVFKIIQAIEGVDSPKMQELIKEYSPFVCLGTVADVAPITDENRTFVKLGLKYFTTSTNKGLRALLEATNPTNKPITSAMIGFVIAPRINAAGRLGSAKKSADMFLCDDSNLAKEIAMQLIEDNKHRQQMEHEIYLQAIDIIEKQGYSNDKIIVVAHKDWHQGVVGIVSSKITERYYKPSILISISEDGKGKGSGRSIEEFNLFEALTNSSSHLDRFGGHCLAAGLSIMQENIDDFRKDINKYASNNVGAAKNTTPKLFIDAKITSKDVSMESIEDLKALEPFGMGNSIPVFAMSNLRVTLCTTMSEGKHLRMKLLQGTKTIDAIGFGMGHLMDSFIMNDVVDIVGTLNVNEYNGRMNLQILLKDIRRSN
jgi:single-stranded-DNA-specific exonuclease